MIIVAAGDTHGAIEQLYEDVVAFESALNVRFAWVLQVGDFGVWPDANRTDGATRRHAGAGDFPAWLSGRRAVPRPTVFVKGNHEDFSWLEARTEREILPGLFYLKNGQVQELRAGGETLRVGGIGGCFGPSDFERRSGALQGNARRHYTREDVDALAAERGLDIVLAHDAPAGVSFQGHRRGDYVSQASGLDVLLARAQPRVCLFGHHHSRVTATISGVPCLGLNKCPHPGSLIAIEMSEGERDWHVLGEWPSQQA